MKVIQKHLCYLFVCGEVPHDHSTQGPCLYTCLVSFLFLFVCFIYFFFWRVFAQLLHKYSTITLQTSPAARYRPSPEKSTQENVFPTFPKKNLLGWRMQINSSVFDHAQRVAADGRWKNDKTVCKLPCLRFQFAVVEHHHGTHCVCQFSCTYISRLPRHLVCLLVCLSDSDNTK